jgi:hypothetical protein
MKYVPKALGILVLAFVTAPLFYHELYAYAFGSLMAAAGLLLYERLPDQDWRDAPATPRQIRHADKLGVKYWEGITRGQLADLIDKELDGE